MSGHKGENYNWDIYNGNPNTSWELVPLANVKLRREPCPSREN